MSRLRIAKMHALPWVVGSVALGLLTVAMTSSDPSQANDAEQGEHLRRLISTSADQVAATSQDNSSQPFETTIRKPSGPPRVELTDADPQGRTGSIACSTCHTVRPPNRDNKVTADLNEFHQGMPFDHGKITCYACHNTENMDTLHLADGTSVEYENVMTLCSQCHGPQARDFAHGGHGGMNGFWDLTRGPRTRNNCVDCHDPHQPQFPSMQPTFKPKDRFLEPSHGPAHDDHQAIATEEVE